MARSARILFVLLVLAALGCASRPRPADSALPMGTGPVPPFASRLERFVELNLDTEIDVLVLSGGGQNGAFGAGVAKGWREAGRPRFDAITGVSTGALLCSHYFLDTPEADEQIGRFYTSISQSDVACLRTGPSMIASDSACDSNRQSPQFFEM